jgi:signal transduction histidine kinase
MRDILVGGYTDSAFWLRLTVEPRPDEVALVLRAWPSYLDEVALYSPDGAGGWRRDVTGDRVALADRPSHGAALAFSIAPDGPTTYYLRLRTTSTSMLGVAALAPGEVVADDLRFGIVGSIAVGLMLAMLIWAGLEYRATRERLMLWYFAAQAISVGYGLALTGYLAVLVPWGPLDGPTTVLVWLSTLTQVTFYLKLLRGFSLPRWTPWLVVPLMVAEALVPLFLMAGLTRIALHLNAGVVLAGPPIITILAFATRRDAPPGRLVVRLAALLQSLLLVVSALPLLGVIDATGLSRHGVLLHGALSGAVAFVILRARSGHLRRAAIDLGLAQRQLEVERREHDVRGRFLAMLSHELKTPLSVIRLSLPAIPEPSPARGRVAAAIDSMTALIDLSSCAERLEQGELPVRHEAVDLDDALRRLAGDLGAGRLNWRQAGPISIRSDAQMLDMVLRNLVDNALKYSPADSTVDIVVRESENGGRNGVSITVSNLSGRGAPDTERMFDKFYRGPGASSRAGLGLGLYVVRGIAELLAGTVTATTDGSRVSVEMWHPC